MPTDTPQHASRLSALFWPIILLGIVGIWLMERVGILTGANIAVLFRLWPLFLIFIGVDMLVGRDELPLRRPMLALLFVVILLGLVVIGPQLGWSGGSAVMQYHFTAPLPQDQIATIRLDTAAAPVRVNALTSDAYLLDAQIIDSGRVLFDYSEESPVMVSLRRREGFDFGLFFEPDNQARQWAIGLNPGIRLALMLRLGSGATDLDLQHLQLDSLRVIGRTGAVRLNLPGGNYEIISQHRNGDWAVYIPADAALRWVLQEVASGDVVITLPQGVQGLLEVQASGSGAVIVPPHWLRQAGNRRSGIWQSTDYETTEKPIQIIVEDRGSGNIIIRQPRGE